MNSELGVFSRTFTGQWYHLISYCFIKYNSLNFFPSRLNVIRETIVRDFVDKNVIIYSNFWNDKRNNLLIRRISLGVVDLCSLQLVKPVTVPSEPELEQAAKPCRSQAAAAAPEEEMLHVSPMQSKSGGMGAYTTDPRHNSEIVMNMSYTIEN